MPALAQTANTAGRTFVSGVGKDAGTCSRAAPCRSFAFALGLTPTGGEIVALDAAGYGTVTITKAVSIVGPGKGGAAISVPAGHVGITVNAPGAAVSLRGIEIDGGQYGIIVEAVGALDVGATVVKGQTSLGLFVDAGAVSIHDVLVTGSTGNGIGVDAGSLVATRATFASNAGTGLRNGGGTISLVDSAITGSTVGVGTVGGTTFIKGTVITNSGLRGVNNDGGVIYLDTTTVTGSGQVDVNQGTGTTTYSYGNNNFGTTNGTITKLAPN